MALPIPNFGRVFAARQAELAAEPAPEDAPPEPAASPDEQSLTLTPVSRQGSTGGAARGGGNWLAGPLLSPTERPLEHLLSSVSKRVVQTAVQDACDLQARLQEQEKRFRALQIQAALRHGDEWKMPKELDDLRTGLDELQNLRYEHGRATAGIAGEIQHLAGAICVRSNQKMAAARGARVSMTPPRSPRALPAAAHVPVDGLVDRIARLEEQMRRLSPERSNSHTPAGSPRPCSDGNAQEEQRALCALDPQQECNRIREAIVGLTGRFDAELAESLARAQNAEAEAQTARRACEALHGAICTLKDEVTGCVQDVFGDLWREYSSSMTTRFQRLRDELVNTVGHVVKEQAFGLGGTTVALSSWEDSAIARSECEAMRRDLMVFAQQWASGGAVEPAAVAALAVPAESLEGIHMRLDDIYIRLDSQEAALGTATQIIKELCERVREKVPATSPPTAGCPEHPDFAQVAQGLLQELSEIRGRLDSGASAMLPSLPEEDEEASEETKRGFEALLQTMQQDQEAEHEALQRVYGLMQDMLVRLAAVEAELRAGQTGVCYTPAAAHLAHEPETDARHAMFCCSEMTTC